MLEEGATYKCPKSDRGCEVKVTKGAPAEQAGNDAQHAAAEQKW